MTETPNLHAPIGGLIPQSSALAEASPDSIQECMGSDPESERFKRNLPRMVESFRALRAKWKETEEKGRVAKQQKASTGGGSAGLLEALKSTPKGADELGF